MPLAQDWLQIQNEWRWTYQFIVTVLGAAIIIGLDLAVIIYRTDFRISTLAVGVTTFFGVLTLSNLLSRSLELDKGEVRNALPSPLLLSTSLCLVWPFQEKSLILITA